MRLPATIVHALYNISKLTFLLHVQIIKFIFLKKFP